MLKKVYRDHVNIHVIISFKQTEKFFWYFFFNVLTSMCYCCSVYMYLQLQKTLHFFVLLHVLLFVYFSPFLTGSNVAVIVGASVTAVVVAVLLPISVSVII